MLTLYEHPLSAYAMKAKIGLLEKGLEFQAIVPEGMASGTTGGAFVEASPRAEIPALIDGDVKVFDSTIILEYLEDKWPNPPLLPQGAAQRARVRMIEDVMDGLYEPNNWGVMEVTRFKRASGALADKLVGYAKSNIDQLQHWLDGQLGGKPLRSIAERLLEIARGGLSRRACLNVQGEDEGIYLRPLARLVEAGRSPADELRQGQKPGDRLDGRALGRVQVAKGRSSSA